MKKWNRLTYYLILNVIVSVIATLTVLFFWDMTHQPPSVDVAPLVVMEPTAVQNPGSTVDSTLLETPTVPAIVPVTPAELEIENTPTTEAPAPAAAPASSFTAYQVQSGDTFESIAEEHNMSVDELIAINGFTKSQPLGEGEVLRIPTTPQGSVEINGVFGAGDLASERILFKHLGEGEVSVKGWQVEDGSGHRYVFPDMSFFHGGAVNLYSQVGSDTVVDLYWGLSESIWSSGQQVVLKDASGKVRATYTIP